MVDVGVRSVVLRETVSTLVAAAEAARAVAQHPGAVGSLAAAGDPALADAARTLAARWEWALQQMADDTTRLADVLRLVADTYDQAEAQVAASFPRPRWPAP